VVEENMNNVAIIGRLTRDSEMKYANSGTAICEFSIAVNDRRKQGDQWVDDPSFFDVTLFGKQAEAIQRYLTKGKQVGVAGRLKQDRWEKDGQRRSKVHIIAFDVTLLGGGEGARSDNNEGHGNFSDDIPF